ncbi:Alpha-L-Rha alpha-1,2-L-rhamnosyltransferase/alpha-L-Rha alpha-1,3-L- rhamnosyltransferase [Lactococcus lactis subsp. lactis bv. diacetylactis]|uniref:rhamnan synthesis F family protein n=1 Tax=Lactococcus lactis TaxID=1358 RepID=UPI001244A7ED|nr:rhamnan synthesis F family protein [Lactococcus lactis]QEX49476.1 Alpha-L-Rha alpha-1,2-L-rhamnosyltransferase/alpha-L-Rha alpha-1,3-L- rhamnosyltransferase [Lactococcus lactis subsp. lactis bv. diacetylactis]QTP69565.1 alpha-L-Rha alpha-1,3-L-rhamnosyltransferase [Lactococcus lactis subsp. lactis bv. diacetylactis]
MKRLLLYVHFNKNNKVSDHVIYQLKHMRSLFEKVIFISNSELSEQYQQQLVDFVDEFIQRENKGFDFAAWRDGMEQVGFDQLKMYDSVTLMNDTCFGPLYEMAPIYEKYEIQNIDFWGITNHRAYHESKNHYFDEHIQSYYKVFNNNVINSQIFEDFWKNIVDYTNVQDVIDHYEIQSTKIFMDAGFKYESVLDTRALDAKNLLHPDFSYYAPDVILKEKVPFIKVKAFQRIQSNGIAYYMLDYIDRNTDYPKSLVVDHLSTVGYPDLNFLLPSKMITPLSKTVLHQTVAVHLHVYYPELLEEFLDAFKNFSFDYDLYLTTNTDEKEEIIKEMLKCKDAKAKLVRTPNHGRDIVPFLALKEELKKYDIVGHFHTKRSLEAAFFAGESWRTELISMLIEPADNIMAHFEQKQKLGIVIADIPSFFRFNKIVNADNENKQIAPIMNDIWKRMKMNKKVNFHDFNTFTMSYGTFFWAKIEVLEPLFNLEIMDREIPNEPLPQNTILHAIERVLIYLAWDKEMDFNISPNKLNLTPFIDSRTLNQRFYISPENSDDIRLRYVLALSIKKLKRLIVYRFYKLFKLDTTKLFLKE